MQAYRLATAFLLVCAWCLAGTIDHAKAAELTLKKGDHISFIGGSLGERMQHDGYLEALVQNRFPDQELVFRDLAFSGDELVMRNRSEGFGSPDEWLQKTQTDVVFAFFGFNESFAGEAGLPKFRQDLEGFIQHTLSQKYNGSAPPRLVLFSPIAHEDLNDRNLPDGHENNGRIALYTAAMAEIAATSDVPFVDLFAASQKLYEQNEEPLTVDGVHLNEQGNHALALEIDSALFGPRAKDIELVEFERLRQAVRDKNFYWFHRYRTTDGYSSYGGRSWLKFVNDQTNRDVMMRELEVLDAMTANRDQRVWAVAQGGDLEVDDSNTPPFLKVISNKPGPGPEGAHEFLSGEEAMKRMTLGKGLAINLYASEEKFPELVNPVQMSWDAKGRLWVAAWHTYPHWKPKDKMDDKLIILEDTDGDGRADVCKTFADDLGNPTGFEFWGGGVLVAQAPYLIFLQDTDGDDQADVRRIMLDGIDSADTHHTANSFVIGPDGGLYFQEGVFHRTQAETPYGPERNYDAGVWRFEPRTFRFERYVQYGFANPHGHVFDHWGRDIVHDGTGANPFDAALISGYVELPGKHPAPPQVYQQRTRPCPGTEILSSSHFPEEFRNNLLVGNVIGVQGILRYRIEDDGGSITAIEEEPIVLSPDANFRPADMEVGPDGALYFTDWHNPLIGHMQHNLRDPSRDHNHGRVYRVTYEGRSLLDPQPIAGQPIEKLVDLLRDPDDRVRYRARLELSGRDTDEVLAAAERWVTSLDAKDPDYEHNVLEALWLHQQHNVVNRELLTRVLASPDAHARAAATRVLTYWHDRVPDALDLLRVSAADKNARVRLEAVRGASFFTDPAAVEVPLVAAELPGDKYLDFVQTETRKTLEPRWKQALARGDAIDLKTDAGRSFFLRQLSVDQLLKLDRTRAVYAELLNRPGVRDEFRTEAVAGLARLDGKSELRVVLDAIAAIDAQQQVDDESLLIDLARLLTGRTAGELAESRGDLERLALESRQSVVRQVALSALIQIDGSTDPTWKLAMDSVRSLRDLLAAVPLISDAGLRATLYDRVLGLLTKLPDELKDRRSGAGLGRYVRIELPRRGTLTLAEVEVYSQGRNVARGGKASQVNIAFDGAPGRAIDGKTSGIYGTGTQTHTQENTPNPWWEVDLGEDQAIDAIAVYNRTEGELGKRLEGFSVIVLDANRNEVFRREGNPAPPKSARFELSSGTPESVVRRAAMDALISIRGRETEVFEKLAAFVHEGSDRLSAIRAMQRIDKKFWPPEQAEPLLADLLKQLRDTPVAERTSQPALDTMELADALASLLPVDDARRVRAALRELGVRVIRVGTLPERMAYDKEVIAVAAGKPVEFLFENVDLMPHNFVIVQPGALEEIGLLGEATAQQPDAIARQYVPPSGKILLSSRLIQTRQSQRLPFVAPTEAGVYPFVCTYPGHWRRMYGALYVVDDLDAYLSNPEAYLAANDLPIRDELLKDRRPRTEWRIEDLAAAVGEMTDGRSYSSARHMFEVASCVSCHKIGDAGREFGADLMNLDPPRTAVELLTDVIDPSHKINEKYQSYTFITEGGKVLTGLVLEETPDEVKLIENPLVSTDATVLKVSDIAERRKSPVSLMPKGLLDKLTRDEILDLIAYIASKGDEHSPLFQGGGEHEHGH